MNDAALIRPATPQDVDAIVDVHREAFPAFFLTSLGHRTLTTFYRHVITSSTGIAFAAVERGTKECVGLVAGTTDLAEFRSEQKHDWLLRYAWAAAPALVRAPRRAKALAVALRSADPVARDASASLMSLAVRPRCARSGVGAGLVNAFTETVRSRGGAGYSLTTDATDNDAANAFYLALGFRPLQQWARGDGRRMNSYGLSFVTHHPGETGDLP